MKINNTVKEHFKGIHFLFGFAIENIVFFTRINKQEKSVKK